MKSTKRGIVVVVVGILLVLLAGFIVTLWLPKENVAIASSADHSFIIDVPMERVRKILVRTNAAKKIIAMSDAELKGQKWVDIDFEMPGKILDRNWHVDGEGKLEIVIEDRFIGQNRITLNQKIDITRQRLHVTNVIDQPSKSIRNYDSALTLTPTGAGNAQFDLQLNLELEMEASWFLKQIVKDRGQAVAKNSLQRQEEAIREVVAEQADKIFILPGQDNKE